MKTDEEKAAVRIGATCIVVDHESTQGLVLGVSRKDDPRDFGLPGGKVELGESPEDCARRELEEETGVRSEKLYPVFQTECGGSICQAFYAVQRFNGPYLREVGSIGWVSWEVLFAGGFGDYNRKLKAAIDALPPCAPFERGEPVCYVDAMGGLRRGHVLGVTPFRVNIELTDNMSVGKCWFLIDEVSRLFSENTIASEATR